MKKKKRKESKKEESGLMGREANTFSVIFKASDANDNSSVKWNMSNSQKKTWEEALL